MQKDEDILLSKIIILFLMSEDKVYTFGFDRGDLITAVTSLYQSQ